MPGAMQDVITPANFCEDRLRGFGVARGRILAFSIDLIASSPLKLEISASEMTYIVSGGALNSTHSLTHSPLKHSSHYRASV